MAQPPRPEHVDEILASGRAHWPRWRNPVSRAVPTWFRGGELDALDDEARARLYGQTRARYGNAGWWVIALAAMFNLPHLIDRIRGDQAPWIWAALALVYALLVALSVFLRRRNMLVAARRTVREQPDWPLRMPADRA